MQYAAVWCTEMLGPAHQTAPHVARSRTYQLGELGLACFNAFSHAVPTWLCCHADKSDHCARLTPQQLSMMLELKVLAHRR